MKPKAMITILAVWAMILAAPLAALGAQGTPGPPTNPGPGGGGSNAGDAAGALYGDLYVIERDGNGVPLTREVFYHELDENGNPTGAILSAVCNQPLAKECGLLPLWAECNVDDDTILGFDLPPGIIQDPVFSPDNCTFNPELNDPCAVYNGTVESPDPRFADLLQTVSFGRESVGRSPASVLDSSYAEALKTMNLATPNCDNNVAIKQDPAGRIQLCLTAVADDGTPSYYWKTIDAPLENLGMYKTVMTDGCLSLITETIIGDEGSSVPVDVFLSFDAKGYLGEANLGHLVCSINDNTPDAITPEDMLSSAVFLGAAADKTSPVTLDEIINMNTYLQVNPYEYTRVKKDTILDIDYFDFIDFTYEKGVDACIPGTLADLLTYDPTTGTFSKAFVDVFGVSPPGVDLRGENGVGITVCRAGLPFGETCDLGNGNTPYDPVLATGCGGANWFAQAAEDARKTIWYLHNFEPPEIAY